MVLAREKIRRSFSSTRRPQLTSLHCHDHDTIRRHPDLVGVAIPHHITDHATATSNIEMGEVLSSIMDVSSGEKRLQTLKLVGTLASVAVFSAVPLFFLALRNSAKRTSRRRRLSFTSVGLGIGTFPPETNAKEPIINAALYFSHDNGGCPSTQDVAQYIIKPLLEYERFSHVPDLHNHICRPSNHGNGNNNSKNNGEIQPLDLIREFTICSDDDLLLNQTIVSHLQDTLGAGRQDLPWWEILIIRNSGLGPSACVLRIHHVIGDGLALVAAFEKLLTNAEDGGGDSDTHELQKWCIFFDFDVGK